VFLDHQVAGRSGAAGDDVFAPVALVELREGYRGHDELLAALGHDLGEQDEPVGQPDHVGPVLVLVHGEREYLLADDLAVGCLEDHRGFRRGPESGVLHDANDALALQGLVESPVVDFDVPHGADRGFLPAELLQDVLVQVERVDDAPQAADYLQLHVARCVRVCCHGWMVRTIGLISFAIKPIQLARK